MDTFSSQLVTQTIEATNFSEEQANYALNYISHYYKNPEDSLTNELVVEYTATIQSQLGLEPTGQLDFGTLKAMVYTPRCGVSDYVASTSRGAKWGLKKLKYFVESYVNRLSQTDQLDLIALALKQWAEVADITFERTNNKSNANLVMSTGRGARDNFDGPNSTLAWAYLPPTVGYNGQLLMKFDLDETWVKNNGDRGIVYLNVACHEFGHMLGLDHSRNSKALMAPYYSPAVAKPQTNDDIPRIRSLYGAAKNPPDTTPEQPPNPGPAPGTIKVEIELSDMSQIKIDGKQPINFNLL